MGRYKASKSDYDTAQKKVAEYRAKNVSDAGSFADTTKKYSSLLSLDAEFAKKDFNDELLQHRDIDIRLRSFYKFVLTGEKDNTSYALNRRYENPLVARFENSVPVGLDVMNDEVALTDAQLAQVEAAGWSEPVTPEKLFLRALYDSNGKQFNSAMNYYTQAIEKAEDEAAGYDALYSAFYHMNRGVLRAEMIEFISSIENNVQVLAMDDSGNTRARVRDQVVRQYDYTDAIEDMKRVAELVPNLPYAYFNLGNLYCLSSEHINSIENYTKAISLYPYMGDAYFNRGLVLIYLKDKEKGCIDLSRAGELGVQDAYGVIKKYCEDENE
jgi:tetratricopeptide (TPR) repeat protein